MRIINYTVSENEIDPRTEQYGGLQGEHNATCIVYTLSEEFYHKLVALGEVVHRVQIVDGAGGYHSSDLLQLKVDHEADVYELTYYLQKDITEVGGHASIHLVISQLQNGTEEKIIYSLPARIRFTDTELEKSTSDKVGISEALQASRKAQKEAEDARDEAKQSEAGAKTSETNAQASETNAQASETNAQASAAAAKVSENNAKLSAEEVKENLSTKLDKVDFIPAPPGVAPAAQYANEAYEAYGYQDDNGNHHQFKEEFDSKATLYQEIPQYMLPMGMTIGDENGRPKNVLVNSGISVEKLNPTMKLIASGTTTAEAPIIAISDTTGGEVLNDIGLPAARPFNLSKFICVKVKVPKASAKTRIWVGLNFVNVGYCINATSTTDAYTYTRFDIYYTGSGNWNYMAWGAGNGQAIGTPWTVPWYTGQGEFVSTINLSLSDNVLFPVGTTYEIYGIEV